MQTKTLSLSDCDIKIKGETGQFAGYASVFGGVDSYGDTIIKGAYEYSLKKNGKPKMYVQHESRGLPVGKWLTVREDDHGLFVEGEFTPGMAMAQDAQAALKHGTVDGLSIGYMLKAGDYEDLEDGKRLIKRVTNLAEVSIVTYPADSAARIDLASVKSEDIDALETVTEFERLLREVGSFDRQSAKHLIAKAKQLFQKREAQEDSSADLSQLITRLNSAKIPTSLKGN
jgi:HK97 family phage prohead protease